MLIKVISFLPVNCWFLVHVSMQLQYVIKIYLDLKGTIQPTKWQIQSPRCWWTKKKKIVGLQNIFWSFTAKQSCSETTEVDDQKHVVCRRSHIDQERRVLHPEIFTDAAKLNALASTSSGCTSLTAHQGCK